MKFAVDLPNFGAFSDARLLAQLAKDAEDAGWDGFFIWDHIRRATDHDVVDPWIALSAIAMNTEKIKIGPMVTPVARRRPWKLARETASLDHLSKGRLIFGAGLGSSGGSEVEWSNLGEEENLKIRAQMLDEGLDIMNGLWSGQNFDYDGQHYQVKDTIFTPTPVQNPRIPVWIAGFWPNKAPFRRAARWDGMIPLLPDENRLAHLKSAIEYVRGQRASDAPFDVVHLTRKPSANDHDIAEQVASFTNVGVNWWVEELIPPYFGTDWEEQWDFEAMHQYIINGPPR